MQVDKSTKQANVGDTTFREDFEQITCTAYKNIGPSDRTRTDNAPIMSWELYQFNYRGFLLS